MTTTATLPPPPLTTPPPGDSGGRRPGPGAALLVGVGIVLGVVAIVYAGFELVNAAAIRTYPSSHQFPITHNLVLDAGSGSVTVVPDATDRIVVDQAVKRGLHGAIATAAIGHDGALHIRTSCGGVLSVNCWIHTTVHVPAATSITGSIGDGSLAANGLTGTIHVQDGDGSIHVTNQVGNVWVQSGNGSVDLAGLTADSVDVGSGDGSVVVGFSRPPSMVSVHSGNGSVDLALPRDGTAYAISTSSGNGSVDNRVANDPGASRHIRVTTGDGSASLHYGATNH
jgi:hypothetical protein